MASSLHLCISVHICISLWMTIVDIHLHVRVQHTPGVVCLQDISNIMTKRNNPNSRRAASSSYINTMLSHSSYPSSYAYSKGVSTYGEKGVGENELFINRYSSTPSSSSSATSSSTSSSDWIMQSRQAANIPLYLWYALLGQTLNDHWYLPYCYGYSMCNSQCLYHLLRVV